MLQISARGMPDDDNDDLFNVDITDQSEINNERKLRSKSFSSSTNPTAPYDSKSSTSFPAVPVRSSRKGLNENLMRCLVQCQSEYTVSRNHLCGIAVKMANMVFYQDWSLHSELPDKKDSTVDESDESDSEFESDSEVDSSSGAIKRRRSAKDLTYVFPSNRSLDKYLEDASYLNLKMVANHILNKEEGNVITVGHDDFTGCWPWDSKWKGRSYYCMWRGQKA